MKNTLQPISSEASGHSNNLAGSSVGQGFANLTKQTDATPSEVNNTGNHLNTGHTDSAFVASYIEDVNREIEPDELLQNSLLESPKIDMEESCSPCFPNTERRF